MIFLSRWPPKKDINVLFLDFPKDDLTTKFGRKKVLNYLREKGFNPFVLKKNIDSQRLNQFYNRAKIIIYLNPLLLKTDFANVVYDVLLSGSFLLTDYKTNAEKLFDNQLITFKTLDQLVGQLNYFLSHEKEAKTQAKILREIVLKSHTMRKRQEYLGSYE
jgi:spore maturation protein CgeB